jgi:hypothetical protein
VFTNNNSSKNVAVFSVKCRKISKKFKAYIFVFCKTCHNYVVTLTLTLTCHNYVVTLTLTCHNYVVTLTLTCHNYVVTLTLTLTCHNYVVTLTLTQTQCACYVHLRYKMLKSPTFTLITYLTRNTKRVFLFFHSEQEVPNEFCRNLSPLSAVSVKQIECNFKCLVKS